MGCWNKTCGLSNLHIRAGDEVMVFVLEQNTIDDSRCYSTAFYRPLLLPFYSRYDDYGSGEDSSGVGLPLIIEGLRDKLIEQEVGENPYHDIAVKKAAFNEELFFESVHEHRLRVPTFMGGEALVEFVMFRKDVVDYILENHKFEQYVGDGKGTTGYGNNYIRYGFSDIAADIPEYIDKLERYIKTGEGVTEKYGKLHSMHSKDINDRIVFLSFPDRDDILFAWDHLNKASKYLASVSDGVRYSTIVRVKEVLVEWIHSDNRVGAEALLTDFLKGSFLDAFMHDTRKVWIPGAHEGSQSQDHDGYRTLIAAVSQALEHEKAEREELEEE